MWKFSRGKNENVKSGMVCPSIDSTRSGWMYCLNGCSSLLSSSVLVIFMTFHEQKFLESNSPVLPCRI